MAFITPHRYYILPFGGCWTKQSLLEFEKPQSRPLC